MFSYDLQAQTTYNYYKILPMSGRTDTAPYPPESNKEVVLYWGQNNVDPINISTIHTTEFNSTGCLWNGDYKTAIENALNEWNDAFLPLNFVINHGGSSDNNHAEISFGMKKKNSIN